MQNIFILMKLRNSKLYKPNKTNTSIMATMNVPDANEIIETNQNQSNPIISNLLTFNIKCYIYPAHFS